MYSDASGIGGQLFCQHSIMYCNAAGIRFVFSKNELIKNYVQEWKNNSFFKRVNYQNLGRIREDDLLEKLKKENNALCIVNTKKAAQMIYKELQRRRNLSSVNKYVSEAQKTCVKENKRTIKK